MIEPQPQPRAEALTIGALTVVAWIIVVGFSTWGHSLQAQTNEALQRSRDVEQTLRRFP